ncbi:hypothetical protein ACYOEI_30610, partial [Singulisphaera rosea]
ELMDDLAFLVLAPQARIDDGVFAWDTAIDSIRRKVRRRVEEYDGERDEWLDEWFEPTLKRVEVRCLSWEDTIEAIAFHDPEWGQFIDTFYGKCLRFNRPQALAAYPGRRCIAGQPYEPPKPKTRKPKRPERMLPGGDEPRPVPARARPSE